MRVVVVGSGGREHALAWRLSESPSVEYVGVWPGNGGCALDGWQIDPSAFADSDQAESIARQDPDLVIIGPEAPLVDGLADTLRERGLAVCGPGAAGARLEGSKIFAKRFMLKHGIPTARSMEARDEIELARALDELGPDSVIKADGLAAGKGVLLPDSREEALRRGREMLAGEAFGDAGRSLLIEERLSGYEVSLLAVLDGKDYFLLPASQDHKRALEGDRGLNTGGMGAYSPVPGIDAARTAELGELVFGASLRGLAAEGIDYRGVLYAGLMIGEDGPRVLEFNCRFGDPETQVLLPRLEGDFGRLMAGAAAGELPSELPRVVSDAAITVVLASAGYPGAYGTGREITGLDEAKSLGCRVFHAGTRAEGDRILSAGGRVLAVTAMGVDLAQAADLCYRGVEPINYKGRYFRRDIGWRVLSKGGVV